MIQARKLLSIKQVADHEKSLPSTLHNHRQDFTLGVINERPTEPDFALAQYSKLRDYLNTHLQEAGIRVAPLAITRDVPEMADQLAAQKVDALIDGVFPTLDIERRIGRLRTTLLVWRKGQREYHTVFFSRSEGPVATLTDLPGRVLVFETHRSTSAHAIPKAYLRQQGFIVVPADQTSPPANAFRYVFAGAELNQAYWVLHGKPRLTTVTGNGCRRRFRNDYASLRKPQRYCADCFRSDRDSARNCKAP